MDCKVPILFAYISLIYIMASVLYLVITNLSKIGTPLKDKIKQDPELLKIKNESSKKRGKIFYISLFISIIIVFYKNPFKVSQSGINNIRVQ